MTAGTPAIGTFKIGRDLGIFGSDAILSDQTLLGVGAPGGNANPGNTSLGRIGIGYIYADFMPQITYISPTVAGFQATVGIFQPLDEFDFSGYSAATTRHNTPMFQGKLTYDYKAGDFAARLWGGFLVQPQEGVMPTTVSGNTKSVTAVAGEGGAKLSWGPASLVGYYYQGRAVGSTALMFDGIADNGNPRGSQGYYVQVGFKPIPKLNLVASYGQSGLNQAAGEVSPSLVRRNEAEVGGAYYSLTDWLTLVAEYAHVDSVSHGNTKSSQDAVTAGAILFF
jgi:predicted porin